MAVSSFVQTLVFGLATGGVISLSAVGMTLSYGVTRFINFSYGELLTLGAYSALVFAGLGLSLPLAVVLSTITVGLVGWLLARIFFDPLMDRGPFPLLVTSVGLAFLLQNVVRMTAGSTPVRFPLPLISPWQVGGVFVPKTQVAIIAISLAVMGVVHLVLRHSMVGKMMRATSDNADLARVSGIRTRRVLAVTWFVSSVVAALGGVLLAVTQVALQPAMGWQFLLVVFAAVLLGGIGSPYGAMLGALSVGLGMEFGATYVSADYGNAIAFVVLVLVLLWRPRGLMGRVS